MELFTQIWAGPQEVTLHFEWKGSHHVIEQASIWEYNRWPWNPAPETAYHLKTQEDLRDGYWQTNIYKCDGSLIFVGASPVAEVAAALKSPPLLELLPKLLRSMFDSSYFAYQTYLNNIDEINVHKGSMIKVHSTGLDW